MTKLLCKDNIVCKPRQECMTENIVTKEQMEALKVLADTNLKISEAKNLLFKLQENETVYLQERELKAVEKIQKALNESKKLIEETKYNHEEVSKLLESVTSFTDILENISLSLEKSFSHFDEMSLAWTKKIDSQMKELSDVKKEIKEQERIIERDKKELQNKETRLKTLQQHIESRQTTLEHSYKIEKNLFDKLTK